MDHDRSEESFEPAGGGHADDWGQLPFDITGAHYNQAPTKEPPFHIDGGDWTFLDCQAGQKRPARFTVGLLGGGKGRAPKV